MTDLSVSWLEGRGLVAVVGVDAADYLARLITQRPEAATFEQAAYGALLTPQGKIVSDFLIVRTGAGFLLDCPAAATDDLVKRLRMFRLRAAVDVDDVSAERRIVACWGQGALPAPLSGQPVRDPRHPDLGWRVYPEAAARIEVRATTEDWHAHRIALAIPEFGIDAAPGDGFPHDIAMDALHGIDFVKGCYVGQEVVSRMRYRGTARRRPLAVTATAGLAAGSDIVAGGRILGALTSATGTRGLAILRLDRIADARAAGATITAGGVPVRLDLPAWADYGWPDTKPSDANPSDD